MGIRRKKKDSWRGYPQGHEDCGRIKQANEVSSMDVNQLQLNKVWKLLGENVYKINPDAIIFKGEGGVGLGGVRGGNMLILTRRL